MADFFSDITSTVLSKTLDAAAARQKAIANNIANVETPGYKRSYVNFETELKRIIETKSGHKLRQGVRDLEPVRQTDVISECKPDGNNVNIDAEIADLAKTQGQHRAATTLLENKISLLRTAINGGK
ncbi:MAG: flagellar basal body rod protein FlgB [Armatimonadota bacterium]|nr:flagellar basal body rod protein FlgB [bacterium]